MQPKTTQDQGIAKTKVVWAASGANATKVRYNPILWLLCGLLDGNMAALQKAVMFECSRKEYDGAVWSVFRR